jgi:hypothetical protein
MEINKAYITSYRSSLLIGDFIADNGDPGGRKFQTGLADWVDRTCHMGISILSSSVGMRRDGSSAYFPSPYFSFIPLLNNFYCSRCAAMTAITDSLMQIGGLIVRWLAGFLPIFTVLL